MPTVKACCLSRRRKKQKYLSHQRYTLCLEAELGCKSINLSCWSKTQNFQCLFTPFPTVQSHSGMPCLALNHALYKGDSSQPYSHHGYSRKAVVISACNIGFTGCFLPRSFTLILAQLSSSIAEMWHKQEGAELVSCCEEETWSFRQDRKRDGELMRQR